MATDPGYLARIRAPAFSTYQSGGIEAVRAWLEAESISPMTLREAFADDAEAVRIIDSELIADRFPRPALRTCLKVTSSICKGPDSTRTRVLPSPTTPTVTR